VRIPDPVQPTPPPEPVPPPPPFTVLTPRRRRRRRRPSGFDVMVDIILGALIFCALLIPAVGLNLVVASLEAVGVEGWVVRVLRLLEVAVIISDSLLMLNFIWCTLRRAMRGTGSTSGMKAFIVDARTCFNVAVRAFAAPARRTWMAIRRLRARPASEPSGPEGGNVPAQMGGSNG
jgi:hypothetical protein